MTEERDFEAEASEQGWTPKENWKGDESKWTDAKTFVERGEKIAGILKSKNERLEDRIGRLEQSNREFGEYHKKTLETQRNKDAEKIEELEAQLAQAVTDGDGQAYTRHRREINDLKTALPQETDETAAWNNLVQSWATENPWYASNPKLAAYADGISDKLRNEGYNGQAYFSELSRDVREAFPEEFKNPNKSNANAVEAGGQLSTSNSKAHTYENLPADAKAAFKGFEKDFGMTKEDYLETYEWEE